MIDFVGVGARGAAAHSGKQPSRRRIPPKTKGFAI